MRVVSRRSVATLSALTIGLAIASISAAPDKPAPAGGTTSGSYQRGDLVDIELGGKWLPGKVLRAMPDGTYFVRFDQLGEENDDTVPATRLRKRTAPAGDPAAAAPVANSPNPPASDQPPAPPANQPARPRFFQGQRVQVKEGNFDKWENYTVYRVGKYHCYVTKDDTPFDSSDAWVEFGRIRPMPKGVTPKPPQKRGSLWLIKPEKVGVEPAKPVGMVDENGEAVNLVEGDTSNSKEPDTSEAAGTYTPDVLPATRPASPPQGSLSLKAGGTMFVPVEATGMGVVVSGESDKGQAVERINLLTNQSLGLSRLPANVKVIGAAADGTRVMTVQAEWGKHDENLLLIFDVTKPEASEVRRFLPFASASKPTEAFRSVSGGCILPDSQLLTVSFWGQIAVWNQAATTDSKETPAALWTLSGSSQSLRYTLSPSGKYVVFSRNGKVLVIETATGNTVQILSQGFTGIVSAISDDGTRLLTRDGQRMVVYSLPGEEVLVDTLCLQPIENTPYFIGNDLAFIGGFLYDLTNGVPLWSYDRTMSTVVIGDRLKYINDASGSDKPRLRTLVLPDESAVAARKRLAGKSDLYALQSGDSVALDVSIGDNADDKLVQRLTKSLTESGYKVDKDAKTRLVARVENGETRKVVYRIMGFGIPGIREREADVRVRKWKLWLEADGKKIWTREGSDNGPGSIQMKEGESMEQAIQRSRPSADALFPSSSFPKRIPSEKYMTPQGNTSLSK